MNVLARSFVDLSRERNDLGDQRLFSDDDNLFRRRERAHLVRGSKLTFQR